MSDQNTTTKPQSGKELQSSFVKSSKRYHAEITELEAKIASRLEELKLKEEKWEKLEKLMKENSGKAKNKIILDIGGKRFSTSKETLLKVPNTYFSALLESGHWKPDEDGSYFIDRNPKTFPIILDYLRYGVINMELVKPGLMDNLLSELDYYQIDVPQELQRSSPSLLKTNIEQIMNWIGNKKMGDCLFNSATDGFSSKIFHSKCDNKGKTLIIIQSEGCIFGGYSSYAWSSDNSPFSTNHNSSPFSFSFHVAEAESFLFTLKNPHGIPPTRYPISHPAQAIFNHQDFGPIFGKGGFADLQIKGSTLFFGFPQSYVDTTGYGDTTFTGSPSSTLVEYQVYQILDC